MTTAQILTKLPIPSHIVTVGLGGHPAKVELAKIKAATEMEEIAAMSGVADRMEVIVGVGNAINIGAHIEILCDDPLVRCEVRFGPAREGSNVNWDRIIGLGEVIVRIPRGGWEHKKLPRVEATTRAGALALVAEEFELWRAERRSA